MMSRPGINKVNSDDSLCMVVGCERKALYLNAMTGSHRRMRGTRRGYCAVHRSFAVSDAESVPYGGTGEWGSAEWVIECSDKPQG